ncbi:MAG: dockerin type I repeat-containing protein [Planctomycetaceae bacterium]|nr:dockerin type I repeat-containing protein [Planctomycetaceae bacterium]
MFAIAAVCLAGAGRSPGTAGEFVVLPPLAVGTMPLEEASGITGSLLHPGVLWTHNDSGNPGIIYGLTMSGAVVGSYNFGSQNDWEDIAVGPGKNGASSIYIADTGDNNFAREYARLYRYAEPATLTTSSSVIHSSQYEQARFQYPNGPDDVEALTVDPLTGEIYLFSKGNSQFPQYSEGNSTTHVYRLDQSVFDPLPAGTYHQADQLGSLSILSRVTAADISPDGRWLLIRSRSTTAYAYERLPGESIADALLGTPIPFQLASEAQGEAIGWADDSKSFFTTSERVGAAIYQYKLSPPGDANLDAVVDGADYTIWADHYLQTGATRAQGDFNHDGVVDGADYTIWADHSSPAPAALAVVPEPASWMLLAGGTLLCFLRRSGGILRLVREGR